MRPLDLDAEIASALALAALLAMFLLILGVI